MTSAGAIATMACMNGQRTIPGTTALLAGRKP